MYANSQKTDCEACPEGADGRVIRDEMRKKGVAEVLWQKCVGEWRLRFAMIYSFRLMISLAKQASYWQSPSVKIILISPCFGRNYVYKYQHR